MTPEEKDLLIAVSEGLAKLLEERFNAMYKEHSAKEQMKPFRRMIEIVKEQGNASNA